MGLKVKDLPSLAKKTVKLIKAQRNKDAKDYINGVPLKDMHIAFDLEGRVFRPKARYANKRLKSDTKVTFGKKTFQIIRGKWVQVVVKSAMKKGPKGARRVSFA